MGDDVGAAEAGQHWERADDRLRRVVEALSYADAIALVVRLGFLFEQEGHHADLHLSWRTLTIELTSHDSGGVTERDHAMAGLVDAVL
jgi:4a-hydroxytetrahydrobiopterin dehydratase